MAYISTEDIKKIRIALKKTFPEFKFSVRQSHGTGISVTLISGPVDFGLKEDYMQINQYHTEFYKNEDLLKKMLNIIDTAGERQNFDKSDSMTDYFHVGYYVDLSVGSYNKPFIRT